MNLSAQNSTGVIAVDQPAPHVLRLRINRPEKRNAIDHAVRQGLLDALQDAPLHQGYRALVLGGVGGVFSAGGDLPSMGGLTRTQAQERMRHIHKVCQSLTQSGVPIVSAFEGVTAGAAVGIGLLGDYIVMGRSSTVLFPFMKLGLTPDWGTLHTLPRRVGVPKALHILSSTQPIASAQALELGLVDRVVNDEDVMAVAIEHAQALSELPVGAYARMRHRLQVLVPTLEEELAREAEDQADCLTGAEFNEGYGAFMGKRTASFVAIPPTATVEAEKP